MRAEVYIVKTILVTGGAGFVGTTLALGFKAQETDCRVIALDNLKRRGSELNLPRLRAGGVEFVHGDVRCAADLEACGPCGLLIECSAEPSVLAGYGGSPAYVTDANLIGAINCLEHARRHGSGFLFLSTSRVYPIAGLNRLALVETDTRFELADDQPLPGVGSGGISEDFPLAGARSLYGATKLCAELLIAEYVEMYGLRAVVNRCGVIAGPWQMGRIDQGVAALWVARHVYGGALKYIGYGGTGKQVRDLLHVDDLFRLVRIQAAGLDALKGGVFNAGGGRAVSASLCEMTALCEAATGNRIDIGSEPETRAADVPVYITDNGRVTEVTGWRPEKSAAAIIEDIHRWIVENRESLAGVLG
jgi:CDP-paratose 2-epimerase